MPENSRMPAAFLLMALLLPLGIALLPAVVVLLVRQRRLRKRSGLAVLTPSMARTLRAYAEAWLGTHPPIGGGTDLYLALSRGPRSWLMPLLFTAMEFAPWFTLRPRFTRLTLDARRWLIERYYVRPGALLAPLAWSRQLARLGYHSTAEEARRGGFRPLGLRAAPGWDGAGVVRASA